MIEPLYTSILNIQELVALHAHQHLRFLVFLILALLVVGSQTYEFSVEDYTRRQYYL